MGEKVIVADRLGKVYRSYARPVDRLVEAVLRRPRHREFTALSDVSFELGHGESLGIVGENGAGKSTLLKILAGIVEPTHGSTQVRGKVASILELGSGFHPELTGRQNIVLNAAMLGLGEAEIKERLPRIIDFSELGGFVDQPVKCYSTGMGMRLGFSIATQVDPDILIIDEALSVGDGYFQKKCMDRLLELVADGRTLLFCSHAMYYITAFCDRALWLRGGEVAGLGPSEEVVRDYEHFLLAKGAPRDAASEVRGGEDDVAEDDRDGEILGPARLREVRLDPAAPLHRQGEELTVTVAWETDDPGLGFHLGVGINRIDDLEVCSFSTRHDGLAAFTGERSYEARLKIPSLPLVKGAFSLYVFLLDEEGLHIYDQRLIREAFRMETPTYSFGLVDVDHSWEPTRRDATAPLIEAAAVRA